MYKQHCVFLILKIFIDSFKEDFLNLNDNSFDINHIYTSFKRSKDDKLFGLKKKISKKYYHKKSMFLQF